MNELRQQLYVEIKDYIHGLLNPDFESGWVNKETGQEWDGDEAEATIKEVWLEFEAWIDSRKSM
jgi:hypothetical protein